MFFRIKNRIINADRIAEFSFDTDVGPYIVEVTFFALLTDGERIEFGSSTHHAIFENGDTTDVEKVARTESAKELRKWVKGMIFLD